MLNFVLTLEAGGQKVPQNFPWSTWKSEYENQTIFELYTDDNKSKYSSSPLNILKSEKKKKKSNSAPSALPELLLLNLFGKFLTERKYLMKTLIFVRLKYL